MDNELKEFISETVRQIKEGSVGTTSVGEIEFEVAVAKTKSANGKLGIVVLGVGAGGQGELKTENVSKVKFSVRLPGAAVKMAPIKWPPGR